ncbi:MAG: rRNA maturation RNase YbeY [Candidatus Paceibacterota bacterium]
MLDLAFRNSTKQKVYSKSFFEKVISVALETTNLGSKKVEVSVNLVGDSKITSLNKKYRDKNMPTDVLSFPLNDEIGVKSRVGDIMSLGDIFISLPTAKKYAKEEGVSLDSKLKFLTVHGFLHLLGYDHGNSKDKAIMFKLQDKILGN